MATRGSPFRKVASGEPLRIPSKAWNSLMDIAVSLPPRESAGRALVAPDSRDQNASVYVENKSGVNCARFGVIGLTAAAIVRTENEIEFMRVVGFAGDLPDDELAFAIALEPISDGFVGRALVVGATQVLLRVVDEDHEFALVDSGQSGWLKTGPSGPAFIVWKEPIESRAVADKAWAIVILGGGAVASRDMFPVKVTPDGGSAGTISTTCTFSYTVKALDGSVLGTTKQPEKRRYPNTPYTTTPDNSIGIAYYDADGALHLYDANELPDSTEECP